MTDKKKKYSKVLNEIFETNIKWEKLDIEDLIQFAVLVEHPTILMDKLKPMMPTGHPLPQGQQPERQSKLFTGELATIGAGFLEKIIKTHDGPLVNMAKGILSDLKEEKDEKPGKDKK